MSITRYLQLIDKGLDNLTPDETAEIVDLYKSVDRTSASKEDFLKIVDFEIEEREAFDAEVSDILERSIGEFLQFYNSLGSDNERRDFSKKFFVWNCYSEEISGVSEEHCEQAMCLAIDNEDEDLETLIFCSFLNDYCENGLWDPDMELDCSELLRALISASGLNLGYEYGRYLLNYLWMGYTHPLSAKQRELLDKLRPLDEDVELSQPDALRLLKSLADAGDNEGHAHIIHSLLHTGAKRSKRITDSRLANAIVTGAINNEKVDLTQFAHAGQSAFLLPAPFKTLKTAMKEGNERAAEILQTILTDRSWRRLTEPRKRGRLAWIIRKLTGQSGKFVPKPRRK